MNVNDNNITDYKIENVQINKAEITRKLIFFFIPVTLWNVRMSNRGSFVDLYFTRNVFHQGSTVLIGFPLQKKKDATTTGAIPYISMPAKY